MTKKYIAIETTDNEIWTELMLEIKKNLGSGVNAVIWCNSWHSLIEELQEDYGKTQDDN